MTALVMRIFRRGIRYQYRFWPAFHLCTKLHQVVGPAMMGEYLPLHKSQAFGMHYPCAEYSSPHGLPLHSRSTLSCTRAMVLAVLAVLAVSSVPKPTLKLELVSLCFDGTGACHSALGLVSSPKRLQHTLFSRSCFPELFPGAVLLMYAHTSR